MSIFERQEVDRKGIVIIEDLYQLEKVMGGVEGEGIPPGKIVEDTINGKTVYLVIPEVKNKSKST